MLRGHVARQRSGRRRVLSSINVGAARLHVRFGPVAYVISHRQRVSAWAGSGGQGPDTCQHRTPAHTRVLLVPGPCWGSDLPGGSELICIGVRCPSLWGSRLTGMCCLFLPRDALWPAHAAGSGAISRVARRRRMGAASSCCRRGYPWFRVPTTCYCFMWF
jgi:hypothetical protein